MTLIHLTESTVSTRGRLSTMLLHASSDLASGSSVMKSSLEIERRYIAVYNNISLTKMSSEKKYKEIKMKEIISTVCALLNTDGGDLVIIINEDPVEDNIQIVNCIRMIEQRVTEIVGSALTVSNTNFEPSSQKIILRIKKSRFLISVNYNLYLPTHTQVVVVQPNESIERIKGIISNAEYIPNDVKIRSHCTKFVIDKNCGLGENQMIQLKYLKAASSKCVTLADRITSKSNKFPCYVSAFANHHGGHFYYGIKDDGIVEGEYVTDKDLDEITKKVGKTISKMFWPDHFGKSVKPQKGKDWDIFIEPVLGIDSMVIPSTYVIVVYVASCPGGGFIEEPESYEILDGKVVKMKFSVWKMKLCHPSLYAISSREWQIPSNVQRCSWSSPRNQKLYEYVHELLIISINNGNWSEFSRKSKMLEQRFSESAIKMAVLSMQVTAFYRKGHFDKADEVLKQYKSNLPTCSDTLIFEVMGFYLEAALRRCQGDYEASYEITSYALCRLDLIPPGLITASFYSLIAEVRGIIDSQLVSDSTEKTSFSQIPEVLFTKALEHLQIVDKSSEIHVDIKQRVHINLAVHHLGCSRSGDFITSKSVDKECLVTATSNLTAVSHSFCEGYALCRLREIQFNSAMAILYYRRSRLEPVETNDKHKRLLQAALDYSKKAESLAGDCQFEEMVSYSQKCSAHCTAKLAEIQRGFPMGTMEETLMNI